MGGEWSRFSNFLKKEGSDFSDKKGGKIGGCFKKGGSHLFSSLLMLSTGDLLYVHVLIIYTVSISQRCVFQEGFTLIQSKLLSPKVCIFEKTKTS